MVFEFADGGTLRTHLENHFNELTWRDKYKLSLDITNGLTYLHALNIIHKDMVCLIFILIIDSISDIMVRITLLLNTKFYCT
jgi:serine/threonine protein kinase